MDVSTIPLSNVNWDDGRRIIRSVHPPIDLFEDIADPADWPLLIAAEQKTNPRLMDALGNIDLVPLTRRVGGAGASFLMAPFTHVSTDRPTRFSNGTYGVLYVAESFDTALFETIHHHERFMTRTKEPEGWTSQFRELVMGVRAKLHDLRDGRVEFKSILDPTDHAAAQILGQALRANNSDGVVYPSQRRRGGHCVGLFYPDLAQDPLQGRHLSYHWNGERVDYYKDLNSGDVFRI